jgi:hypothetical protein
LIDVHSGGYGQYRQASRPGACAASLCAAVRSVLAERPGAIADIPLDATAAEVDEAIARFVGDLRSLWRKAREIGNAAAIQQRFINVTEPLFRGHDRIVPGAPARVVARLNNCAKPRPATIFCLLTPRERANGTELTRGWRSRRSHPRRAARAIEEMSCPRSRQHAMGRRDWRQRASTGSSSEGSAAREAHLALQHYAKMLKEWGVILAVCSKKDQKVAEAAFRDHPEMALGRSDIAAFVANWDDKALNLKAIVARLNVGVDSLVFVDDNPVEGARPAEPADGRGAGIAG